MRQYKLFYKRLGSGKDFVALEPGVHRAVYDQPEINAAIEIIRTTPHIEGIVVRLGEDLMNIIAFVQEALAPQAFEFTG
jgi:hypothetical protein